MAKRVSVTFFSVTQCGFYRYGEDAPEFGNLSEVLRHLAEWGQGRSLWQTRLADAGENVDHMPVYLLGVRELQNGDFVFATWNEVPQEDGNVISIGMDTRVGEAPEIHSNEIVENTIPGYATYYWAVPHRGVVATVRVDSRVAAKNAMTEYVRRFMATESAYIRTGGDDEIIGYGPLQEGDDWVIKARARFKMHPYSKEGQLDFIRHNRASIFRVHKIARLDGTKPVDENFFQSVIRFMSGDERRQVGFDKKISVALDFTPTPDELEDIIDAQLDDVGAERWEDVGFEMSGLAGQPYWVSKSSAKDSFESDDLNDVMGVIPLDEIAHVVTQKRDFLLGALREE